MNELKDEVKLFHEYIYRSLTAEKKSKKKGEEKREMEVEEEKLNEKTE